MYEHGKWTLRERLRAAFPARWTGRRIPTSARCAMARCLSLADGLPRENVPA